MFKVRRVSMVTMMDTTAPEPLTLAVQSDDDDGCMSTQSSEFGDGADLMAAAMGDEVTAQLAAAGWQKQQINGDFLCFRYDLFLVFLVLFLPVSCTGCVLAWFNVLLLCC